MLRLFAYWMSPWWKSRDAAYFSDVKCKASRASACASVMGGMLDERGRPQYPVKLRLAYWMMSRAGSVAVAGW